MSNQARHGDGRRAALAAGAARERDYYEREAARRADNSEAALRRSVSRLKLKLAIAAARPVEMPCGHTVPSNPLRPDWCSTCERLTGGVE